MLVGDPCALVGRLALLVGPLVDPREVHAREERRHEARKGLLDLHGAGEVLLGGALEGALELELLVRHVLRDRLGRLEGRSPLEDDRGHDLVQGTRRLLHLVEEELLHDARLGVEPDAAPRGSTERGEDLLCLLAAGEDAREESGHARLEPDDREQRVLEPGRRAARHEVVEGPGALPEHDLEEVILDRLLEHLGESVRLEDHLLAEVVLEEDALGAGALLVALDLVPGEEPPREDLVREGVARRRSEPVEDDPATGEGEGSLFFSRGNGERELGPRGGLLEGLLQN